MNKIGFIDSGIGGLTVLKSVLRVFPNNSYIYYADNLNNPYGNKTKEELLSITTKIVDYLINKGCNIIVIACGTISSNLYDELSTKYKNITFIKTLPKLDKYIKDNKKILFMATERTCKSNYIKSLENNNLIVLPSIKLASLIEEGNRKKINNYLKEILSPYKNDKFDIVMLGCTHYPLVKDIILKYINTKDVSDASGEVILELNKIIDNKEKQEIIIYNSKEDKDYNKRCFNIIKE